MPFIFFDKDGVKYAVCPECQNVVSIITENSHWKYATHDCLLSRRCIDGFMSNNHPKVGLGVVILKNDTVLLGIRQGSHCEGQRCLPGGHLEHGETIEQGSRREVLEETGLEVKFRPFDENRLDWLVVSNILEGQHYIGVFTVSDWIGGEPKNLEPTKNKGWEWVPYDKLIPMCKPGCAWIPTELFINYQNKLREKA